MTQGGNQDEPHGQHGQGFPPPPPADQYGQGFPAAPSADQYGQGFPPAPPADQYGQQYGQQQYGQQYPQPSYGQAPWVPPGYGGRPAVQFASWGQRAVALILDGLFSFLLYIPGIIVLVTGAVQSDSGNEAVGTTLMVIGGILMFAAFIGQIWNQGWRQGAQGWSWGKQVMKIKLVRTVDAQPPGGGPGLGRLALRTLIGNATLGVYTLLTYLWPLWDEQKQSLDDKILNTWVIRAD